MTDQPWIARISSWAFTFLCIVASSAGFFVLGILGAAISELTKSPPSSIALVALVGLIAPTVVLIIMRHRGSVRKRSDQSIDAQPPENSVVLSDAPASTLTKPQSGMMRAAAIGLLLLIAVYAVATFIFSDRDNLGIELRAVDEGAFKAVRITNTNSMPIQILSVKINGREECNTFPYGGTRELKEGDRATIVTTCVILRVAVATNRGSTTYTFK